MSPIIVVVSGVCGFYHIATTATKTLCQVSTNFHVSESDMVESSKFGVHDMDWGEVYFFNSGRLFSEASSCA